MSLFKRQTQGSTLCPSCGQLVGVRDERCFHCGRPHPGMWGFTPLLRGVGLDFGFVPLVVGVCVALYVATLAVDMGGIGMGGMLLTPSSRSLFVFGSSGAVPVFGYGRWWTVLSAAWLHAGLLHILFNMLWVRDLGPPTVEHYGPARTALIWTAASIVGFLASSVAGAYLPFLPGFLRGAGLTVGASAPILGLLGALVYYGQRTGSRVVGETAKRYAVILVLFGFIFPGVDNWAHLGGFAGGWAAAHVLDPLAPERLDHLVLALACLLATAAAVVVSVVTGLPLLG
jgi:rhomboid protease GluP